MTSIMQEDPLAKPTNPPINPQASTNPPSYNDIIDKVSMYSIPHAWQRRSDLYLQKQSASPPLTEQEQQKYAAYSTLEALKHWTVDTNPVISTLFAGATVLKAKNTLANKSPKP